MPAEKSESGAWRNPEIVSTDPGGEMEMPSSKTRMKARAVNVVARLLLTATALAPVGFTYAWVAATQHMVKAAIIIAACSLALVIVCLLVVWRAKHELSSSEFHAQSIEAADHENTAFLLLYVMPLFTSQFNTLRWEFWAPTAVIFILITATGYNYHFNPLMGIFGWHFYKVQSTEGVTFVVITRRHIRSNKEPLKVGYLTEYILLDVEE